MNRSGQENRRSFRVTERVYLKYEVISDREFHEGLEHRKLRQGVSDGIRSTLLDLDVPLVCAGGIGDASQFVEALDLGYDGVQLGTRFIATTECHAHDDYKQAILKAVAEDIVLTDKISAESQRFFQKLGFQHSHMIPMRMTLES